MDTTTSTSLWGARQSVGDGGYHIDLPGDSEMLLPMLKALKELNFIDQFTRSVDFQLVLINSNRFSVADKTLFSTTMDKTKDHHPVVMVNVVRRSAFFRANFMLK